MRIARNSVVTFDFSLRDGQNVIESSVGRDPALYLHGHPGLFPALQSAMEGRQAGDAFVVEVPAEQAFGTRNEELVQPVSRANFPPGQMIHVGQEFQARGPNGEVGLIRIVKIEGDDVTVDANHRLAGVNLTFDVTVREVREATPEEIAHGHVHGPGGHHH